MKCIGYILTLVFCFGTSVVRAQDPGRIVGIAREDNGGPAIGAIMEVYSRGIKKGGTLTDTGGRFVIGPLPPGKYDLIGQYAGYKRIRMANIFVQPGKSIHLDLCFEPPPMEFIKIPHRHCGVRDLKDYAEMYAPKTKDTIRQTSPIYPEYVQGCGVRVVLLPYEAPRVDPGESWRSRFTGDDIKRMP